MSAREFMKDILTQIAEKRIVPVVKLDRAEDAAPLAAALMEGGLPAGRSHLPHRRRRSFHPGNGKDPRNACGRPAP